MDLSAVDRSMGEISYACRRSYLAKALDATFAIMRDHMVEEEADVIVCDQ